MRILILGSGAREHAIAHKLLTEKPGHEIICAPGNAALITAGTECVPINPENPEQVLQLATSRETELVVIGPEAPLIAGVADPLRAAGIPVFGPSQAAAQLEGSKEFAKRIMREANVPTGESMRCTTVTEVVNALAHFPAPHVVKADGLAAGKGVLVTGSRDAALQHARQWLPHGDVLVEEYLAGEEVSLFFLSDGQTVTPLTPARDYKRVHTGDKGPNTGGMGAYSPLPWLPADFIAEVTKKVAKPTVNRLKAEGTPFIGLLYCGLIITGQGIKVIEFNARFGDPETQVVLARMTSPLSDYLHAAATGKLHTLPPVAFSPQSAVIVVLANQGYPGSVTAGGMLHGLAAAEQTPGVHLVHAGTTLQKEAADDTPRWIATGGRVVGAVAIADSLKEARENAYAAIEKISLAGGHYREDIALLEEAAEEAASV